ncbi:hypothetical protein BEH94_04305 [Candidatus Altiarchaeales archaeon WOR_SM1_SCG]|nr:hypothetical protein BEH94_04305 [Candidatus Altiarchaeales archaeon WOR_SM1_SCG]
MIQIQKIENSTGIRIEMQNAPLLLLIAEKGFIACGYLNIEIAEKIGDCACAVSGVKTFEDVLNAKIDVMTSRAKELGIVEGMPCSEALKLMG